MQSDAVLLLVDFSLLLRESFLCDRCLTERAVVIFLEPLDDARRMEEVSLIARQGHDLILLSVFYQADRADNFLLSLTLDRCAWHEFSAVEVLYKVGRSWHPIGLLLLASGVADDRDEKAEKGADAAAFKHLKVAKDDDY